MSLVIDYERQIKLPEPDSSTVPRKKKKKEKKRADNFRLAA